VQGLRGQCPIADRVELDNYYIDNWSLGLDFKILLMTLVAVVKPAE
jgi:lipopolysaccharide/colanic/teichoic acid biosynthesis glycosyltransferase